MKDKKENLYCNNCGEKVNHGDIFCNKCGKKIIEEKDNIDVTIEEAEEDSIKVTYEPKKDNYSVLNAHKEKNENKYVVPFITALISIVVSMILVYIYCTYFLDLTINTTKLEKDVTVTDKGIADAVEKIYDAVVVVENYASDKMQATGTGFVYKKENGKAYILTNYHVVDNATDVYVVLTNDKKIKAEFINGDDYSDIAVLSVKEEDVLKVALLGSSKELRVGDTTFAVGAPIDASTYSWTVTRGILSGKDRLVEVQSNSFSSANYVIKVLQTDTAINSGNSGGPLCNSNGEVIGITNMKISSSTVEGMGFAIPIETAIEYADKYISGEEIVRPYLGITMYDVTSRNNTIPDGVYIQSVEANSPASKAGLQKGDVITAIDKENTTSSAYLKYELYKHNVGDKVEITYYRDGKEKHTSLTLGSYNIKS